MKTMACVPIWTLAGTLALAATAAAQPARFPQDIRSQDGSGNNLAHPEWGRAGSELRRRTAVGYENGTDSPAGADRPSARVISNTVAAAEGSRPNARGA